MLMDLMLELCFALDLVDPESVLNLEVSCLHAATEETS